MKLLLIVRLGALGDIVHALPAVAAMRRAWPDARDRLAGGRALCGVVELVDGHYRSRSSAALADLKALDRCRAALRDATMRRSISKG